MPETRKAKRSFESQAISSLEGVQISPVSRMSNPARKERARQLDEDPQTSSPSSTEAVELITRLIEFIKMI